MNVEEAQLRIAQVLQALEKETQCMVEAVHIRGVDVTRFEDESRQLLQSIQIELKRQPGARWQTGAAEICPGATCEKGEKP